MTIKTNWVVAIRVLEKDQKGQVQQIQGGMDGNAKESTGFSLSEGFRLKRSIVAR